MIRTTIIGKYNSPEVAKLHNLANANGLTLDFFDFKYKNGTAFGNMDFLHSGGYSVQKSFFYIRLFASNVRPWESGDNIRLEDSQSFDLIKRNILKGDGTCRRDYLDGYFMKNDFDWEVSFPLYLREFTVKTCNINWILSGFIMYDQRNAVNIITDNL